MSEFRTFITPNSPEATSSVLMNNSKTVVMSLAVNDIQKGDILVVTGECELTNNTDQWARFARAMILASSPSAATGFALTESNEENFNPKSYWVGRSDVHHLVATKAAIATAPASMTAGYVNFLAWSSTDPPQPSYALTVERGYGRLSVLKIRP